jgi:hypothetical protein
MDSPALRLLRHLFTRGDPLRLQRKPCPARSAAQTPLYTIALAATVVQNLPQFRPFPPVSGVSFTLISPHQAHSRGQSDLFQRSADQVIPTIGFCASPSCPTTYR